MPIEQHDAQVDGQSYNSQDAARDLSSSVWDDFKSSANEVLQQVRQNSSSVLDQFGALSFDTGKAANLPSDRKPPAPDFKPPSPDFVFAAKADFQVNDGTAPLPPGDKPVHGKPVENKDGSRPEKIGDANAPFVGREINRDVEPSEHTVKKGDTLTKIAREHLGPDATAQEVHRHVLEIAKFNGIKNPDVINPGQELKLPGHTADGGTVTKDAAGNKTTAWKDGAVRVDHTDGTGHVSKPDGSEHHWGPKPTDNFEVRKTTDGGTETTDHNGNRTTRWDDGVVRHENKDGTGDVRRPTEGGGYSEHHWGPKPEDNYEIVKGADGKYRIGEKEGDKVGHEPKNDTERTQAERARLNDAMHEKLGNDPEALDRVEKDMAAFEKRAKEQQPPMSPEEVAKTYEQISKLLESTGDQPISQSDRVKLAEQVLHQSAHPNEVRQGFHGTCNTATVESRMYTRNPSDAAKLVTEVATTGKFTTADGRTIQPPVSSLVPDTEGINHPSPDGQRSHASQIFQVTAVNDIYDRRNNATTPPGQLVYEQDVPTGPNDTGERIYDYSFTPKRLAVDSAGNQLSAPGVDTGDLQTISNDITGKNEKDFVIINGKYVEGNTVRVMSEDDLGKQLEQMKKDGKMPVIVWVDAQNEPFFTDSGAGSNGGSGGAHVVTVTDYDPVTGKVQIDNQWDQADDHEVSLHDLYRATRPASDQETIDSYKSDVAWDKFLGTEDGMKEFELLRLQKNAGQLTDAQYDQAIIDAMRSNQERWGEDGETYTGEEAKARAKYNQLLRFLPADRAQKVRDAVAAP